MKMKTLFMLIVVGALSAFGTNGYAGEEDVVVIDHKEEIAKLLEQGLAQAKAGSKDEVVETAQQARKLISEQLGYKSTKRFEDVSKHVRQALNSAMKGDTAAAGTHFEEALAKFHEEKPKLKGTIME